MDLMDSSTALLLEFYEHAPCGFHSLDSTGVIIRINDTELQWIGYSREEVIGRMKWTDLLTPAGCRVFENSFQRFKAERVVRDLEYEVVRKNGTTLPVLVTATAITDEYGKFLMSRSIVYDLSYRKHGDRQFRDILDAAPDVMIVCDGQGKITLTNAHVQRVFGYEPEELRGKPIETLVPDRFRVSHPERRKRFLADPTVRSMGFGIEVRGRRKDGTEFPVEISLSLLRAVDGLQSLAIVRDVTDRKLVEDALRKSEEHWRTVISTMAEGVVVQERDGKISTCNESAERILGLTEDQMMGRTSVDPRWGAVHEDGSPFPGEDHPAMVALRTGERQTNVCMGVRKPTGGTTWILINAEPIFYSAPRIPRAVVSTFTDITDRKRLEEHFIQAQKLEAIGRLAGGIAHDFNNILGVILGHCELMAMEGSSEEHALQHASAIKDSAERAAALTRQLLAFSRKQVMQLQPLDMNDVVRHLAEMLQRLIGENIELVLQLDPNLGRVNADPVQIEQVIMNLIVNARDAMPKGGRLTIATENVELARASAGFHPVTRPGSYVMIAVTDTGTGMNEETQARLFEPFFTTKELGRGTGMGLSIIYGVVRQSGGNISVQSQVGRGSTFQVLLPRVANSNSDAEKTLPPAHPEYEPGNGTILLVEDDDDLRELVSSMLAPAGYTVLAAASGTEALSIAEENLGSIALLLSDVVLRGSINGPELARQLRVQRPDLKVLFVSGYSETLMAGAEESGLNQDLLEKPFTADELRQKVRLILKKT